MEGEEDSFTTLELIKMYLSHVISRVVALNIMHLFH
jgi:hypothetical protein